jgi:hypothetical protein
MLGLNLALNSLSEPPLVGPLSGAKQTPLWQPAETGFDHLRRREMSAKSPLSEVKRTSAESFLVNWLTKRN